jgi:hypothetical protein
MIDQLVFIQMTAIEVHMVRSFNFISLSIARATISRGASDSRLSYFCINSCRQCCFETPPKPRKASVMRKLGFSFGLYKAVGMKLNELHVFNDAFCTIHHSYAIAGCKRRIGSGRINVSDSACSQHGDPCE